MYVHQHFLPPALVISQNQKYIVPGWVPVPMETDLCDIKHVKPKLKQPNTYQVNGSKGAVYTVTVASYGTKCTCPAGKFRGKCKHIKEVMLTLK